MNIDAKQPLTNIKDLEEKGFEIAQNLLSNYSFQNISTILANLRKSISENCRERVIELNQSAEESMIKSKELESINW